MLALLVITGPTLLFAENKAQLNAPTPNRIQNPLGAKSLDGFVASLLGVVVKLGSIVAALFIIYAGFMYVTAQGNEEKLQKAKMSMMWTIIGSAILLGAQVIANAVANTVRELK